MLPLERKGGGVSVHVARVVFLLLGSYLDEVIDSEDGYGSLGSKLETLYLTHGRLQDACPLVVPHSLSKQVQTNPTHT